MAQSLELNSIAYLRVLNKDSSFITRYLDPLKVIAPQQIEEKFTCEVCGSSEFTSNNQSGETTCSNCGAVHDDHCIDHGKEWRSFDSEENDARSRVGSPCDIMKHDKGLSTVMSDPSKDCNGTIIDYKTQKKLRRLRGIDIRYTVVNREGNNFKKAMEELRYYSQILDLNKRIREEVAYNWKKIIKGRSMRGKTTTSTILALISLICQKNREPRPLKDIRERTGVTEHELNKNRKNVIKMLNIKLRTPTSSEYLERINSILNAHGKIMETAKRLLLKIESRSNKLRISIGREPAGVAAGCFYLSSLIHGGKYTQSQVSKTVKITEVTVRNRYREICHLLGKYCKPQWLRK